MKSINSKDIGKTDEQIVLDAFNKALEEACKNYIGEPNIIKHKDLEALLKQMQKHSAASIGYGPCLICGSLYCEEDDCQLGVE